MISPRFDVAIGDMEKWSNNLLPSRQVCCMHTNIYRKSAELCEETSARCSDCGRVCRGLSVYSLDSFMVLSTLSFHNVFVYPPFFTSGIATCSFLCMLIGCGRGCESGFYVSCNIGTLFVQPFYFV